MFKNAFSTLIWNKQIEEKKLYQEKFIEYAYKLKKEESSEYNSNTSSYQSKLLNLKEPIINNFVKDIEKHLINYINVYEVVSWWSVEIDDMWININQKNDYLLPHMHSQKDFSGVFMLKCPKNSGSLVLQNPDSGLDYKKFYVKNKRNFVYNSYNCHEFFIEPSELKLILFPSHIKHYVTKNETDDDRITVAFDFNVINKDNNEIKEYV